jgi:hypothetical protein
MPVWIIHSPLNATAVNAWWSNHEERRGSTSVTMFAPAPGTTLEAAVVGTIGTIDVHHGPEAQEFPFSILSVCGVKASAVIRETLRTYGLTELCDTSDGFVATKPVE